MALLSDILTWTESRPMWQRDACRRLLYNESGLADEDYSELFALLKKENQIETDIAVDAVPLASDHLPAAIARGETVVLLSLRELENVNQIPQDQALNFSEMGITVIYGGNGSGKSGYARVMKRACRARDQSEPIHPNANDPAASSKIPTAKFVISVAGACEEIAWSRDSIPYIRLSTISVFDSRCARSYITAEQDVAYLPYGLDLVENLANIVLPKLSEMLESEISSINADTLPFQHLIGETKVGEAIQGLSFESDDQAIISLGTLSEDESNRIADLEKALKEKNPLAKAEELRRLALRLKTYAGQLAKPLAWVSNEAVAKLQCMAEERKVAEEAEAKAADTLRSGEELLPGTGDQTWKLLFQAARRYSIEAAYQGVEFPSSDEGKVCPLCQEELSDTGTQRLKRFDEYIKDDVAKSAETARQKVETAKVKIEAADLQIVAEEALRDEIKGLDDSILSIIDDFQESILSRRSLMLGCLEAPKWEEIPTLSESPRARVRQIAADRLRAHRTLVKAADQEERKKLEGELTELSARQNLAKSLSAIIDLLVRLRKKAALEKCRTSLKTRSISDKSKEFATAAVTEELRRALDA